MHALSKAAEQKLIQAIENAATYVNAGLEPNAAIIKSAAEHQIPAGHVTLMVHAYNTGRTNKQREQGDDTYEKAADFKLADAAIVLEKLYPTQVKTSAEIRQQAIVSTEYGVSPLGFLNRRRAELAKQAAAAQTFVFEKSYVPPPADGQAAVLQAHVKRVTEKRAAEELRRQHVQAEQQSIAAMDKLAEYFRVPGNMSFNDALREVGLRLGTPGTSVLEKISAVYPQFKKQAATNRDYFGNDVVYDLVSNVLQSVATLVDTQRNLPVIKVAAAQQLKPEPVTGSILHDPATAELTLKSAARTPDNSWTKTTSKVLGRTIFGDSKAPKTKLEDSIKAFGDPIKTTGDMLSDSKSTGGVFSGALGFDVDPDKEKLKAYQNITTPEHELELKNIRAQSTLHDMLTNDPVISGYDATEVANVFNEIATAAPNIVDSPAILRAMLRKRLEAGQFADFDAKQLLEMDKIKTERDNALLKQKKLEQDLL